MSDKVQVERVDPDDDAALSAWNGVLRSAFPDTRRVHTWNADSNAYMVSINEALGFAPVARESAWRLDLPRDGASGDA